MFFAIVNPLYNEVSGLRTDLAIYNTALDNSTELQKTRDSLVDKYKNIKQEDKDRLEHFLPNTVNNIKFILEIEQLANLHNMPITNIKFDPQKLQSSAIPNGGNIIAANDPSSALPYGSFPIEFTTEGNYETFIIFLKDIEHNLRLVNVKSISFTVPSVASLGSSGSSDSGAYTYSLKIETYWLK